MKLYGAFLTEFCETRGSKTDLTENYRWIPRQKMRVFDLDFMEHRRFDGFLQGFQSLAAKMNE